MKEVATSAAAGHGEPGQQVIGRWTEEGPPASARSVQAIAAAKSDNAADARRFEIVAASPAAATPGRR